MERTLWYCTTPGVELWLPTASEEAEVYEEAEEERRRTSPVMQLERLVRGGERHPERRLPDGTWTEDAAEFLGSRR